MDSFDVEKVRMDFPILSKSVHQVPLVYFDNAATTQKPFQVIEAIKNYYEEYNANPHRGAHLLSVLATAVYEDTREKVRGFINATSCREIIFTRNTTESLNLIAYSYGRNFLKSGDEILLTITEHHSNIVPWQDVAKVTGAVLKFVFVDEEGRLNLEEIKKAINKNTKIVSICHMSNVLGSIHPLKEIGELTHKASAIFIVDGAQSIPHIKIDVKDLNADFFVFSAHKMYGPMGIGVLYGKEELLQKMPPFLFGGDMIEYVSEQDTSFAELPFKFEAGTQNVEGVVGLSAAIDYIEKIGYEVIEKYEKELTKYAIIKLLENPFITLYGPKDFNGRGGVISFNLQDVHPHDVASIVDTYGVALRSGHHCAQPLMKYLRVNSTCRVSFSFYNTKKEIDIFIDGLNKVRGVLGYGA